MDQLTKTQERALLKRYSTRVAKPALCEPCQFYRPLRKHVSDGEMLCRDCMLIKIILEQTRRPQAVFSDSHSTGSNSLDSFGDSEGDSGVLTRLPRSEWSYTAPGEAALPRVLPYNPDDPTDKRYPSHYAHDWQFFFRVPFFFVTWGVFIYWQCTM